VESISLGGQQVRKCDRGLTEAAEGKERAVAG
jgi:hypothetical protein